VNHKPATQLPWKLSEAFPYIVTTPSDRIAETLGSDRAIKNDNAAYIAHAANAYPRLVSYLEDALVFVDYVADNGNNEADMVAHGIRTLLRELGEAP